MRRRPSPLRSAAAAVLVCLLATACGGDADTEEGAPAGPATSETSNTEPDGSQEPAPEPLVAGAGAGIDPADTAGWCGAVTPEQLSAATGYDVAAVDDFGQGLTTCDADLPGVELRISWGSEPTQKSFERYEAGFDRPADVYETSTTTLGDEQPAVVALQPGVRTAFAGTVADGRLTQVVVIAVAAQEADPVELGDIARQLLAVYVD